MIFLELVLQNFGGYYGRQIINLRPEIGYVESQDAEGKFRPIILIGGMNGGGKTTFLDAIRLALYGQRAQCSSRGNLSYSDFLNQSVNKQAKAEEETIVELLFEHILENVPVEFRIVRKWRKSDRNEKDSLGILVDDWKDQYYTENWDEVVEDLLPLGISNLFLFDGEQVKELAELDAPPAAVVEAIQSLLGLELAEKLSIDLEILVSRKRKALVSAKSLKSIEEIESKLEVDRQKYLAKEAELKTLRSQLQQSREQQDLANEKFLLEGGKIAAEKSQLESKVQDLSAQIERSRSLLIEFAAHTLPLQLIAPLLEQARSQAETEIKTAEAQIALQVTQKQNQRLLSYISNLQIDADKVNLINDFLERENQEIKQQSVYQQEPYLHLDLDTFKQLDLTINHELLETQNQTRNEIAKVKDLELKMEATERQLALSAAPELYATLSDAVTKSQKALSKIQTAYDSCKRELAEIETNIQKSKKELAKYSEETIDKSDGEHIIKTATKVQETLQLFKQKLTLRKLNQLESVVTECFLYLLHKSDLVHRLSIDVNTYAISLYDLKGLPVNKKRLSAGEKQLLAIAFLWGLARVSGRKLPVAIDTPLGRLDSSHRHNLVERYFPAASHQVILLSTDTEIGKVEVAQLREQEAIAREYFLRYDGGQHQTVVQEGYFW
ncbi:DNA sulfur modification protein DndD [Merismopedia glauca]|uniref:Nuclease SbcCD subunit C n=1 Tax=Merismopedia glauca CCAP 1448/3 TaxID=1296344 RepID=A0A2T1C2T1_9CYAN|nr:DNA sulfur modification protein DndD [Merismopedia glauca]PSB02514.1 DNA sulfur modification protein DndD [Merismopedia glauca CCAP 1448/3]